MGRWFFSYEFVDTFGDSLIEEIARALPLAARDARVRPWPARRRDGHRAVVLLRRRVQSFDVEHGLNFFQRARLSQRIQNGLLARNYPLALAEEIALTAIGYAL